MEQTNKQSTAGDLQGTMWGLTWRLLLLALTECSI